MNPDDLAAIARRVAVARQAGIPAFQSETTSTANALPQQDQVTALRQKVLQARQAGYTDPEIDRFLRANFGTRLDLLMTPNQADYLRAAASGATMGFNDEIAGLIGKLTGHGYAATRDAVRANEQAASAIAPKTMLATEIAGGALPGILTAGLGAAPEATAGARAVQAAKLGGVAGGVAGFGHSTANTLEGNLTDAAKNAIIGSLFGAALSGAGSGVSALRSPVTRSVAREANAVLPPDAAATLARQEELAPGTAVLGDRTKDMVPFARGVGADRDIGRLARDQADARVQALNTARQRVGQQYDQFEQKLPVDDNLRRIVGGRIMLPGDEVPFSAVQDLRSDITRQLRAAQKTFARTGEKGDVVAELAPVKARLDDWLQSKVPGLDQVDADYGFVTQRLDHAKALQKQVAASLSRNASARAAGYQSVSPAAQLQRHRLLSDVVQKILSPTKKARAAAIQRLLLTPEGAATVLGPAAPLQPSALPQGLLFGLLNGTASGAGN